MSENSKNTEILGAIKEYIEKENLGSGAEKLSANDPRVIEAAVEIGERTKSILGGLYYDFKKQETSPLRKIKNKVIEKIANIVRNTLERPLLTQQKFNEQTFFLVQHLLEENKKLQAQIVDLKSKTATAKNDI